LERMTPWSQAQAKFGYSIKARNRATGQLEVDVVATSRELVDEALAEARSAHFNPSLVDCADGPVRGTGTVLAFVDQGARQRAGRLVGSILGALLFISFLSFVAGMWDLYRFQVALNQTERQISEAKQQIAMAKRLSARNEQIRLQSNRLFGQKSERPSVSVLIEVISRKLPDEVWLERLEIGRQNALLTGEGANAAALIAVLEGTEHFTNVRFSAPTTRTAKGRRERFTIAAQALPVFRLGDVP